MKLSNLLLGGAALCLSLSTFAATPPTSDQAKQDGEILGYLVVLNKNEIAAANLALKKAMTPDEKKFAQQMIHDHSKNLSETLKISQQIKIKPVITPDVTNLKNDGTKELKDLSTLKSKDFQQAYAKDMVQDHTDALTLLDKLLGNVNNDTLKKHLEATHEAVGHHLEEAKSLEAKV